MSKCRVNKTNEPRLVFMFTYTIHYLWSCGVWVPMWFVSSVYFVHIIDRLRMTGKLNSVPNSKSRWIVSCVWHPFVLAFSSISNIKPSFFLSFHHNLMFHCVRIEPILIDQLYYQKKKEWKKERIWLLCPIGSFSFPFSRYRSNLLPIHKYIQIVVYCSRIVIVWGDIQLVFPSLVTVISTKEFFIISATHIHK